MIILKSNFITLLGGTQSGRTTIAQNFGKKGTSSDMTLYSHDKGEETLTVIDPFRYPENLKPMVQSLRMADTYILCVGPTGVDKSFGETILTLETLWPKEDLKRGVVALTAVDKIYDSSIEEKLRKILKSTLLSDIEVIKIRNDDTHTINQLKQSISTIYNKYGQRVRPSTKEEPVQVWIDHSFPVKGVGTVILGKTMAGLVEKSMNLTLLPGSKNVTVRSIQLNDVEVKEASAGVHIGLALRGISPEEITRGSMLVTSNSQNFWAGDQVEAIITINKFGPSIIPDMPLHINYGLEFLQGKILSLHSPEGVILPELNPTRTGVVKIKLDREIAHFPDASVLLCDLNRSPRIIGGGREQ